MAKKPAAPIIDVVPDDPEVALATQEGGQVQAFVAGLRVFFERARHLETHAKATLLTAKTWQRPTSKEEDEHLVANVRSVNAQKREVEDHWTITAMVSRFHRRLTAARDRGVGPLEEAAGIGNRLHAAWAEEERRRAREEDERQRREAEERARRDREQELADLERLALEAEASSPDLSEREARFVDYLTGPYQVPARAAQQAGFKSPEAAAARLLAMPKIAQAVEQARSAKALRDQAAARRAAPVVVEHQPVKAAVAKGGAETWSGEVYDPDAFLAALLDPMTRTRLGIPSDIATFLPAKVNEYARSLHEQIDRWPGVRHKKTTSIR